MLMLLIMLHCVGVGACLALMYLTNRLGHRFGAMFGCPTDVVPFWKIVAVSLVWEAYLVWEYRKHVSIKESLNG
jgi:hypothetical protein